MLDRRGRKVLLGPLDLLGHRVSKVLLGPLGLLGHRVSRGRKVLLETLDLLGHRAIKVLLEILGHKARLGQWAVEVPPEKLGSRGHPDWTAYPACPRRLFGLSYGLI